MLCQFGWNNFSGGKISVFKLVLLLCGLCASVWGEKRQWKFDRQPKISSGRLSLRQLSPIDNRPEVQQLIVDIHNYFRARVKPSARNMLEMTWDSEAAEDATRWSQACRVLEHDNTTGRWVDDFGSCGQNIFISTHLVPWLFAVETWWLEKDLFHYGRNTSNDLEEVGHYTQLVWAASHKVGCGLQQCQMEIEQEDKKKEKKKKRYFLYICNYCPIGNFAERLGTPYEKGPPCSGCKKNCKVAKYSREQQLTHGKRRRERKKNRRRRHSKTKDQQLHPLAFPKKKHEVNKESKNSTSTVSSEQQHHRLCTNACPVADLWSNCKELATEWRQWLCHERKDPEGRERFDNCRATCTCKGKVAN